MRFLYILLLITTFILIIVHTKTHEYFDVVKESGPIVQQFSW